jgi:tRNA(Ile2) C34 agmatinyltransferase TiaS
MSESNRNAERVTRRGFLRGTVTFAAAIGAAALPAAAQQQGGQSETPQGDSPQKDDADKKAEPAKSAAKKLVDKEGREYRICDMCGGNMYKQDKTWTCEQCGYSYDE